MSQLLILISSPGPQQHPDEADLLGYDSSGLRDYIVSNGSAVWYDCRKQMNPPYDFALINQELFDGDSKRGYDVFCSIVGGSSHTVVDCYWHESGHRVQESRLFETADRHAKDFSVDCFNHVHQCDLVNRMIQARSLQRME